MFEPSGVSLIHLVGESRDVRILPDDVSDLHLAADHSVEADSLNSLGVDVEPADILRGQEAHRASHEQEPGGHEQRE